MTSLLAVTCLDKRLNTTAGVKPLYMFLVSRSDSRTHHLSWGFPNVRYSTTDSASPWTGMKKVGDGEKLDNNYMNYIVEYTP